MIKERLLVSKIAHNIAPLWWGFQTQDFLIDQSQTFGGGGVMETILHTNLAQDDAYIIHIEPPTGTKFHLNIPDGQPHVIFNLNLGRIFIQSHDGPYPPEDIPALSEIFSAFTRSVTQHLNPAEIEFKNLQYDGRQPAMARPQVGYFEHAVGIFLKAEAVFFGSATFEEIIIHGQYAPPVYPPDAFFDYYPARWQFPRFLALNPYVFFWYNTSTNSVTDPGRFIEIG
jgi:hypothetical protein